MYNKKQECCHKSSSMMNLCSAAAAALLTKARASMMPPDAPLMILAVILWGDPDSQLPTKGGITPAKHVHSSFVSMGGVCCHLGG